MTLFDQLAAELFEAAGLGVPFDDMLPPRERLSAKHHGGVGGDCFAPNCQACAAAARDLQAHEAGQTVGMTAAEDNFARAARRHRTPLERLPQGVDPRSREAYEFVKAETEAEMFPGGRR